MEDHFIVRNGVRYAGTHLLIDLYEGHHLDDLAYVREVMLEAANATGANILNDNFHDFDGDGVTGVVSLSESHTSIHTWPRAGYAVLDIFTCGDCDPNRAVPVLKERFKTDKIIVKEILRGPQDI